MATHTTADADASPAGNSPQPVKEQPADAAPSIDARNLGAYAERVEIHSGDCAPAEAPHDVVAAMFSDDQVGASAAAPSESDTVVTERRGSPPGHMTTSAFVSSSVIQIDGDGELLEGYLEHMVEPEASEDLAVSGDSQHNDQGHMKTVELDLAAAEIHNGDVNLTEHVCEERPSTPSHNRHLAAVQQSNPGPAMGPEHFSPGHASVETDSGSASGSAAAAHTEPTTASSPSDHGDRPVEEHDASLIAICGVGLRLPGGIRTTADYWDLLVHGRDAASAVPASRYNIAGYSDALGSTKGAIRAQRGYFLDEDLTALDTSFFSMTRRQAELCDPQQRQLLEVVKECLDDAGETAERYRGRSVGCYVGTFGDDWLNIGGRESQHQGGHGYVFSGNVDIFLANRVSFEYDLKGPR